MGDSVLARQKRPATRRIAAENAVKGGFCDHCGAMITGERIKRKLKRGGVRLHDCYRCANNYPDSEHPSVRWRADDLEDAIVADLAKLRMPDDEVANWFRSSMQVAFSQIGDHQRNQRVALSKRRSELATMNDRLLNAFLSGSIDEPRSRWPRKSRCAKPQALVACERCFRVLMNVKFPKST